MAVAVLGGIIFVKHVFYQKITVFILPTLNGHGEEYQLDYVSTEDSALEILDYIKQTVVGIVCNRWCFTWWSNCHGAFVFRQ